MQRSQARSLAYKPRLLRAVSGGCRLLSAALSHKPASGSTRLMQAPSFRAGSNTNTQRKLDRPLPLNGGVIYPCYVSQWGWCCTRTTWQISLPWQRNLGRAELTSRFAFLVGEGLFLPRAGRLFVARPDSCRPAGWIWGEIAHCTCPVSEWGCEAVSSLTF